MQRSAVSLVILVIGIVLGIGAGLFYAWQVDPRVELKTNPWQLADDAKRQYMIIISMAYSQDHDLQRAANRLSALGYDAQTWQVLAQAACDLSRTSYISTNTGLTAVRSMVTLAQSQGATNCASQFLPADTSTPAPSPTVVTVTPSLIPPSTKTPTPTLGPTFTPEDVSTEQAQPAAAGQFKLVLAESYCSAKTPGLLEIYAQDVDGAGIPGIQVQVEGPNGKDLFFTGLKSERDPGYADYQMDTGQSYSVTLPSRNDSPTSREAISCNVAQKDGGGKSTASYRLTYRRVSGS